MTTKTTFWDLITKYKISIPIIHRDYALGRENEEDRRNRCINRIHEHLENNQELYFNFIYGRIDADVFTPLDGHQHLITLFLLHWYFSLKEDIHIEDRKILNRFEYDSNTDIHQFCHALINKDIEIPSYLHKSRFADTIRNKYWYKAEWDKNLNIQSMMVIIEAIHQKFHDTKDIFIWDKLTEEELITFDLLDLGEKGYSLIDQLYIKANVRGKQNTFIENFKPKFIQFIESQYKHQVRAYAAIGEVTYANYFAYNMDREWTDLFWTLRKETASIDSHFKSYFQFITQLLYCRKTKQRNCDDFKNTFDQYKEVYRIEENLTFLFESLDNLYKLVVNQKKVNEKDLNQFFNLLKKDDVPLERIQELVREIESY